MKANKNTQVEAEAVVYQTVNDFKNSILIVSVLVNLFILTTWLVIQASPTYGLVLVNYL